MEIEKDLSTKDAIAFVRQIADALEQNQSITMDKQFITISQATEITLEYEEEGYEVELEIEFNWSKANRSQGGTFKF